MLLDVSVLCRLIMHYILVALLGQENATIDCDEGVPITPFNLKDEMEEGYFDAEGNYFVKKDAEIRDNWLDNIDWVSLTGERNQIFPWLTLSLILRDNM